MRALEETFDDAHIDRILKIPIGGIDIADAQIWRGDNSRVYSARSGYRLLLKSGFTQAPLFSKFYNGL